MFIVTLCCLEFIAFVVVPAVVLGSFICKLARSESSSDAVECILFMSKLWGFSLRVIASMFEISSLEGNK